MPGSAVPEGRFMVGVGAIIEHTGSGRILLLKRAERADYEAGIWEDITGRMKQGEEPEDALRREEGEGRGLEPVIVKPVTISHLYGGDPTVDNELVGIIFWCKSHSDAVVLSREHSDYRWLLRDDALRLVEHPGV